MTLFSTSKISLFNFSPFSPFPQRSPLSHDSSQPLIIRATPPEHRASHLHTPYVAQNGMFTHWQRNVQTGVQVTVLCLSSPHALCCPKWNVHSLATQRANRSTGNIVVPLISTRPMLPKMECLLTGNATCKQEYR